MRILLSSLIALIVCGSSDAFAQAKKIDCSKLEFSISLPFQECTLELTISMAIQAFVGRGHDAASSYNVGIYKLVLTSRFGLGLTNHHQLLEGTSSPTFNTPETRPYIYKGFFVQTPPRSSRSEEGAWLRFDATVLRPDGSAKMNCLQFSKVASTSKWIVFGSLCVKDLVHGVPKNAADLVLQSLQVNTR